MVFRLCFLYRGATLFTFVKNYVRRFQDTDLFKQIFYRMLKGITDKSLISENHVFIDSNHVKASANKRKFEKKLVRKETRVYEAKLQSELNKDSIDHGRKHSHLRNLRMKERKKLKKVQQTPKVGIT